MVSLVLALALVGDISDLPIVTSFASPVKLAKGEKWAPSPDADSQFGADCTFVTLTGDKKVHWGNHLGEDRSLDAGTEVLSVADGRVMYLGTHTKGQNWGGVVIIVHRTSETTVVYSLYGHIDVESGLKVRDPVKQGQRIGRVAKGNTPSNGMWPAHLHFQINLDYYDKYRGGILAGYAQHVDKTTGKLVNNDAPNRLADCIAPSVVYAAENPVALLNKEMADKKRK